MDLEAAPSSGMLNKKAPVGAFSGSTGGLFSQKKRVSLHHMIQSSDKHEAALAKPHSKENQYSDMESDSGDSVAGNILAGSGDGSLFGSAATTPKTKRVKSNLDCGSPLGFLDYNMDDDDGGPLLPPLGISLDRIWLDPKIIKTQVKVVVKKSFALDVNISNVEGKSVTTKTQLIKKIFSKIIGFGGVITPSKFEEIIRSTFTSEENMKKAVLLARENGIIMNTDLKKQGVDSDQAVSFLIGKDSVCVAKAVGDHETWAFRDQFRVLLFTLSMETTAHDLGTFLEEAGRKTCVINHSLETGNRTHCAVVCFESDEAMESAFHMEPIFGGVKLSWARLDLVHYKWCEKFGHSVLECDAGVVSASQSPKSFKRPANLDTCLQLAKLYAKKKVPISCPIAFGGKFWAQVVSVALAFHDSHDGSGSGSLPFGTSCSGNNLPPLSMVNSPLGTHLACLECSVELLSDQISNIFLHFDNLSLVPSAPLSNVIFSVGTSHPSVSDFLMVADSNLGSNIVLDVLLIQSISLSSGNDNSQLGLSSSKSGDRNKAVLAKSHSGGSQYSDIKSDSGDSVAGGILADSDDGSLLGSAATTPKAKRIKNNLDCSSPLGSLDYNVNDNDGGPLPPPLVEVAVRKFFALDINLLAVEGKSATAKTQLIRKLFSKISGFGGTTTPSKFDGIIRSTFTLSESLEKAISLAKKNNIIVNSDLKRQGIHLDRAIVIKKIPMDTPKKMIITTVSEYGQIVSIKVQLIGLWQKAVVEFAESSQADLLASKWSFLIGKDSVRVAKTVGDHETWAFRDQFRALLFTLLVGTTAYDLGNLLEGASGKTCVINHLLETGNRTHCVVIWFESNEAMESAFHTEPIFGGVKLSWVRLDLVCCEQYGKFGHSALECDAKVASVFQSPKSFRKPANLDTRLQLAKLYAKKKVPISCPVAFGGKFWAQVVSVASVSRVPLDDFGSGSLLIGASNSGGTPPPLSMIDAPLGVHLACLKCSIELLSDQISNILLRFDNLSLVPLAPSSNMILLVNTPQLSVSGSLMVANSDLDSNMVLDVLTSKVGVLESKLVALDASIGLILAKLEQLCAGSGSLILSSYQ
ncbi:hypothetical protein G9A89_020832 [Geosiphon pyriformis]|nr:hypothetical protein G9A89_020832 [Geosiphon pyriformis]